MSYIRHYRVLPWATGPLTLLESIAKVPDQQVGKTGKSSIFWLSSFLQHDSMITAEAIPTVQTRKNSTNHWVLHSPLIALNERTWTSRQFWGNPTLMLAALHHFVEYNIHSNYVNRNSTEHVFTYNLYSVHIPWKTKTATAKVRSYNAKHRSGICMLQGKILYGTYVLLEHL